MTAQLACLVQFLEVLQTHNFFVKWFENSSTLPTTGKVFLLANIMRIVAPFKDITASLNKHAPVAQNLQKVIYHRWHCNLRIHMKSGFAYRSLMLGLKMSQNLPILLLYIHTA